MALRHVAWFRFKDGVTVDRIDEHLAACRALVGRVPAVQNLECGPNLSDRAGGLNALHHRLAARLRCASRIPRASSARSCR